MTVRRTPYTPERKTENSNNSAFNGSLRGQVKSAKPVKRKRSTSGSMVQDNFLSCGYIAHYTATTFLNTTEWGDPGYNLYKDKLPRWTLVAESGDLSLGPKLTHAPLDLIAFGEVDALDVLIDTPDRVFEFAGPRRLWLANLKITLNISFYSSSDFVSSKFRVRDSNISNADLGVYSDMDLVYPNSIVETPFTLDGAPGLAASFMDYRSGQPLLLGDNAYFHFIAESTMPEPTVIYELGLFCLGVVDGSIQTQPNLDYDLLSVNHEPPI